MTDQRYPYDRVCRGRKGDIFNATVLAASNTLMTPAPKGPGSRPMTICRGGRSATGAASFLRSNTTRRQSMVVSLVPTVTRRVRLWSFTNPACGLMG